MFPSEMNILVGKTCRGDAGAAARLYEILRNRVLPRIARELPPQIDAEDIFEDAFLEVWKELRQIKNADGLFNYTFITARHILQKKIVESHRYFPLKNQFDLNTNTEISPGKNIEREELIGIIKAALGKEELCIFQAIYIDGYTQEEICRKLKLSENILKIKKCRLNKKLRNVINKFLN